MIDLKESPYKLSDTQIDSIHHIINKMTLDEKIGQLFFLISPEIENEKLAEFIAKYCPGGMMYRPDHSQTIKEKIKFVQSASKIPVFIAANLESGGNGLITEGTWVGTPLQVSATNDTENAYQLGNIASYEAKQIGGNMSFSPIVDIDYNFRNPITNTRTFGSNPKNVLKMAQAQIKGLFANDVLPVIKHFPGDGVDERDQHLLSSINSFSLEEWEATYGTIYQALIDQEIPAIMIGHILQPAIERYLQPNITNSELRPASLSNLLIEQWLRKKMGFNGLAITDATPMIGYNVIMPRHEALIATINAGIDMILFTKNIEEDYQTIKKAVKIGEISNERLQDALTRILATKYAQKIIDSPARNYSIDYSTQFKESVIKIARESITLVKDRDQLLPMLPEKYPKIRLVILGDSDAGGFKSGGFVGPMIQHNLQKFGFEVDLYSRSNLDFHEIFEEGVEDLKSKFDLALYIANVENASNQTTTRLNWIQLMAADAPWFMKDIPTIFISTANPYHLFDIPNISTYINAYTGNEATIDALFRKLIGKEAFIGKSPVDPFCGQFDTKL